MAHAPRSYKFERTARLTTGGFLKGFAYSLNPYIGCAFGAGGGCPFCYVRALPIAMKGEGAPWGSWVIAKINSKSDCAEELAATRKSRPLRIRPRTVERDRPVSRPRTGGSTSHVHVLEAFSLSIRFARALADAQSDGRARPREATRRLRDPRPSRWRTHDDTRAARSLAVRSNAASRLRARCVTREFRSSSPSRR